MWLEWIDLQNQTEVERENWLYNNGGITPRMPEPYEIYLRLRRSGLNIYSGGYYNQPHYTLLEFDACMQAEQEITQMRRINAQLKANVNNG